MTVDADNNDEAVDKLTQQAKEHLAQAHPDIEKTDQEVRDDIATGMVRADDMPPAM